MPSLEPRCSDKGLWAEMIAIYHISLNKHPGTYFLQGLQDLVFQRDRAFIPGSVHISYRLFWKYGELTAFSNCDAPTWSLSASSRRPPSMAAMAFICAPKDNRSMNINEHSSLDANFAVKLHVHAVCKARPLRTLAFISNQAVISYWAVKLPAFKRDLAFTQIRRLLEKIQYIKK